MFDLKYSDKLLQEIEKFNLCCQSERTFSWLVDDNTQDDIGLLAELHQLDWGGGSTFSAV